MMVKAFLPSDLMLDYDETFSLTSVFLAEVFCVLYMTVPFHNKEDTMEKLYTGKTKDVYKLETVL